MSQTTQEQSKVAAQDEDLFPFLNDDTEYYHFLCHSIQIMGSRYYRKADKTIPEGVLELLNEANEIARRCNLPLVHCPDVFVLPN